MPKLARVALNFIGGVYRSGLVKSLLIRAWRERWSASQYGTQVSSWWCIFSVLLKKEINIAYTIVGEKYYQKAKKKRGKRVVERKEGKNETK